jgi:hypothetical protein
MKLTRSCEFRGDREFRVGREDESTARTRKARTMGRHRRSAAGRAATGRAGVTHNDGSYDAGRDPLHAPPDGPPTMGIAPYLNPEAYAETYAKSEAYLFATEDGVP